MSRVPVIAIHINQALLVARVLHYVGTQTAHLALVSEIVGTSDDEREMSEGTVTAMFLGICPRIVNQLAFPGSYRRRKAEFEDEIFLLPRLLGGNSAPVRAENEFGNAQDPLDTFSDQHVLPIRNGDSAIAGGAVTSEEVYSEVVFNNSKRAKIRARSDSATTERSASTPVPSASPSCQFFYLRNGNILVINDLEVAVDLLERRSAIYSDRESSVMLEIRFFPAQYKEVHLFLRRLINTPSDCMQHCMALSQGAIYSSVYGLDLEPGHDIARKAIEVVHDLFDSVILQNGAFHLLNRFPWLRYMPSWFPGCHFKRLAAHAVQEQNQMREVPFDLALNDFKTKSKPSLIAELVAQNEGNEKEVESLKAMASVSVIAAADTTGSLISSFILTMVMHPKVQTKGQEEIDRVIGADRLPTFADRPSLPYIESIYRELMRLHPPLPLCMRLECDYDASAALKLHPMFIGVSHASTKDDIYRGYCIPKGSISSFHFI
ncbi:hypothetical protein D9757_006788 [Collybiopsis confluens]|uniref:Cytochrome P450 n=1 Tax=Collybiopsis confluens TaxID=2823264 RepID=A0A8H5HLQ0_9AGAR|nr:hypothetical protein D9757_006788 [Collybiopsis confluens]